MSSGIQQVMSFLTFEKSGKNKSANVAIISVKCITECLIIQSVLEKFNKSTLVLFLNPKVLYNYPEVTAFFPPAIKLADAFLTFVKSLDWNKFGLITNSRAFHLRRLAFYLEYVARKHNMTVFPVVDTHNGLKQRISVESLLQKIETSGAKVLVVLTEEAPHILCAAYARGMVWPYYGWIIYGYISPELTNFPACTGSFSYLDGAVFPTYYTYPTTKASLEDTAVGLLYKASAQATLLNTDIKTALLRLPVPGIQPNLTFHEIQNNTPAVYFLQMRNGTATRVATVLNGKVTENQWLQEEQLPRGRLPVRVNRVYPTWLAAIEIIVSGFLITLTLFLYIYYRNEPEIRATSWSLSLLMFLGCYMVMTYLILSSFRSVPALKFNICLLLVWMSALGIPYTVILAVLLVKLVRIYRIFYHHNSIGRLCSDVALAVYVLLLTLPTVLILTALTIDQPYQRTQIVTSNKYYVEMLYVCSGDLDPYSILLPGYTIFLTLFIILAAIKTRKLRHKNFRDAKKVNIFIFLIVPTGIFGLVIYDISYSRGQYLSAYLASHLSQSALIGLCLGLLFLPKLYPIICRNHITPLRLKIKQAI